MMNISKIGENLQLDGEKQYIIIDSLYLNEIRNEIQSLNKSNLLEDIRIKVFAFPFTDTPFAEFTPNRGIFQISSIKIIDFQKITDENRKKCFSSDTGLLVVLCTEIIEEFLTYYDYDQLVDSDISPINVEYWMQLVEKFNSESYGLILTPGIDSGFEFEGSGLYKVSA